MENEEMPVMGRPETLRGQVETFLREAIMNGRFAPGERLVERELCELLQVSRPPLREALRRLEAEKLLVIVPHKGPVVASLDIREAKELYALRALLEGFAVHEFARLADAAQIKALERTVKELHAQAKIPNRRALLVAKTKIYDVLLGGSGNRLINEVLQGLLSRINLLRATSFSRPERLAESLAEIDEMVSRIKARDAEGAREAAQLHIKNAENAALGMLESND
ncbi:FCD domain-containing protein [Pseudomonas syringae]|uniref:FCD domain-containing protein n=1 Tax=Pseudomonas syringae TaxID=317 RepID=A0A9Q3ZXU8_PSESX|nr:FCD domain-containing protein [Pseudomonas syringae]MCF5063851.1 FCD domain-containing protein [Pseudomonas syringae]MCF5071811.1 FCD domain-containing protein [Pseudomonas syringae]MCF5116981.1 FCD domain-containing protein [Pseudomonas syringae]MCF5379629.1 FCD domain-containing protein [Pseudomonas syringae]